MLSVTALACATAAVQDWSANRYTMGAGPPEQVHIAYAGKSAAGYPTGMNIGWAFHEEHKCHVHYGLSADALNTTSEAAKHARYLDEGAYHYNVDLLDLVPLTHYFYRVECADTTTGVYNFVTASNSNELEKPYVINVFGDMGWLSSEERPMVVTVHGLEKNWSAIPVHELQKKLYDNGKIDMMWLVGDIAYADDAFSHDVVGGLYEKAMDGFINWQGNTSANLPYHVSVGNHESECHSPECVTDVVHGKKLANFSAYNTRWHMPSSTSGGVMNMWFSWNTGPVHFVSLNTETDFPGAGEEKKGDSGIYDCGGFAAEGEYLKWLESDLKQAYADKKAGLRPFIVVGGHRHCKHGCQPDALQGLFDMYEVDLFVAGHAHKYARSVRSCQAPACKLQHNSTYETSYVYSGASGGEETAFITTGPTFNSSEGLFETSELSTGFLTIVNSTTLQWQLLSAFDDHRVIDEFWMHTA